jgi:hypothetical protein
MDSRNDAARNDAARKPEPKKVKRAENKPEAELQVEELEERIAPIMFQYSGPQRVGRDAPKVGPGSRPAELPGPLHILPGAA